jgi:hypothetical protein
MFFPQWKELKWFKARRSYATGQCVELARAGDQIAIRNSKNPDLCVFRSLAEVSSFIEEAKRGQFDHVIT